MSSFLFVNVFIEPGDDRGRYRAIIPRIPLRYNGFFAADADKKDPQGDAPPWGFDGGP